MKRLLVVNCFEEESYQVEFNNSIASALKDKIKIATVNGKNIDSGFVFEPFSHIILSGSHLSAYENVSWYEQLEIFLKKCVENEKAILGICFGHQFLIRALVSKNNVKKATVPEFGWKQIKFKQNPIFNNINSLVSMVSHYDEVFDLPGDFQIIASSNSCKIHAFQLKGKSVFGVQFHPEYSEEIAKSMFERHFKKAPQDKIYFVDERNNKDIAKENLQVLKNFISLS